MQRFVHQFEVGDWITALAVHGLSQSTSRCTWARPAGTCERLASPEEVEAVPVKEGDWIDTVACRDNVASNAELAAAGNVASYRHERERGGWEGDDWCHCSPAQYRKAVGHKEPEQFEEGDWVVPTEPMECGRGPYRWKTFYHPGIHRRATQEEIDAVPIKEGVLVVKPAGYVDLCRVHVGTHRSDSAACPLSPSCRHATGAEWRAAQGLKVDGSVSTSAIWSGTNASDGPLVFAPVSGKEVRLEIGEAKHGYPVEIATVKPCGMVTGGNTGTSVVLVGKGIETARFDYDSEGPGGSPPACNSDEKADPDALLDSRDDLVPPTEEELRLAGEVERLEEREAVMGKINTRIYEQLGEARQQRDSAREEAASAAREDISAVTRERDDALGCRDLWKARHGRLSGTSRAEIEALKNPPLSPMYWDRLTGEGPLIDVGDAGKVSAGRRYYYVGSRMKSSKHKQGVVTCFACTLTTRPPKPRAWPYWLACAAAIGACVGPAVAVLVTQ